MEQPNQQPIREKTENKPPVKTNWKFIAIVVIFGLVSVAGILLLRGTNPVSVEPSNMIQQTPPPSRQDQIQGTFLAKVYDHGGLCPTGECRSQIVINRDGTFVYVPDLNIESEQNNRIEGSIGVQKLLSLTQAIEQSDFQKIKEKKFTERCPTAYDGSEAVYTFYVGVRVEEIASCRVAIDYTSNPFQIFNEIMNNEIRSRTQGEDDRDKVTDTSSWQTYRNDEFGFEVRYPSNWSIIGETTNEPVFSPDGKVKIYTRVHVSGTQEYIYSLAYREEQECPERIFKPGEPVVGPGTACPLVKPKETKEININGISGYFKERESGSLSAYLPRPDKKIALELTTQYSEYKDVFNQILSTFRFID